MMTSSMTLMRVVYIRADDQEVRLEALIWSGSLVVVLWTLILLTRNVSKEIIFSMMALI